MASFTETFDSLAAWDFGSGSTAYLTLDTTGPLPYLGASRASVEHGDTVWAAARFDLDDGGVPATTYWMSYAFYLDSWSDVFDTEFQYVTLPGFINLNDDPLKGQFYGAVDDVNWNQPFLEASSSSAGKLKSAFAGAGPTEGVSIAAGEWHTVRYGLRLQGATSHQTMYVDNVLIDDDDMDLTLGPDDAPYNQGVAGVVIAFEDGITNAPPYILPVDTIMYSAVGDPGEPAEAGFELPECGSGVVAAVFIDSVEVTHFCVAGSWTPRLNRPAQASVTTPMESGIVGDCGSLLKIVTTDVNATPTDKIVFHGKILNIEVDTDKDGGRIVWNAQDDMELWAFRPARDNSGDFSKPDFIQQYDTGPLILEALLINTVDSTGRTNTLSQPGGAPPGAAEGPISLDMGTFEAGGKSLAGAPVDWPMTIMEIFQLMVSTGQLDAVITYTDPGGGITGTIDAYNGDYGTDRSADVVFQYGVGDRNVQAVRWNRDMTQMVNKYWLYGGPRVASAADPAGEQHWCFSVTGGTPSLLDFPPGGPLSPPESSTNNPLGVRRFDSIDEFGVRMRVDIQDGYDEDCIPGFGTPGRALYERQWQVFSWFSAFPRELIHITPNPDIQIGCFDIGDIVGIEITTTIRGGIAGAQRVYEYTVSWEGTPSLLQLSEIQTSADAEGSGG